MTIVLIVMLGGLFTGYLIRKKKILQKPINFSISIAIFLLLFLLGISVGGNEKIISGFLSLGTYALIVSIASITGSIIAVMLLQKQKSKATLK
jgi:uncharacterized membrane protein YbjE (DUF340 family)